MTRSTSSHPCRLSKTLFIVESIDAHVMGCPNHRRRRRHGHRLGHHHHDPDHAGQQQQQALSDRNASDEWNRHVSVPVSVSVSVSVHMKAGNEHEPDLVEKLFSVFFGKKEATPFGLKRFDETRFPELYPATLTEFASPVQSDTQEMAVIRPLLKQTQLESRPLQLVYDAHRDGWTANAFHDKVNKKGAGVVLALTQGGALVGGYNPKGWVGYGESRGSVAAFLFTWPDMNSNQNHNTASICPVDYPTSRVIKLRKVGGAALSVIDNPDQGPQFGADSLVIPLRDSQTKAEDPQERIARCKLGSYYERRPDKSDSLFAKGENKNGTVLTQLRVYVGVYAEGEEIPFSDALPYSLE